MRTRPWIILALVAILVLTACSSTTVVARDERAAAGDSTAADDTTATGDESNGGADDDSNDAETTDGGDVDRGDRTTDERDEDDDAPDEEDDVADGDLGDSAIDLGDGAGFGLGGAEQIEALLDDCENGSDLACDVLFQISAFDSPEEETAVLCGGRSETEVTFCTEGVEALPDQLVFDPDSDGIEPVVERCQDDGDMTACDFLYYRSPIDSELQEVGGTCGGRVSVAVPDCRTLLADG